MTRFWRCVFCCWLVASSFGAAGLSSVHETQSPLSIATILVSELPREGRETLSLIHSGGPFPYSKDGSIFSNRERILPMHPRGFYHEYTVKTPRARDRGARRIICGGASGKPHTRDTCYYTDDHYASFKIIKE